MEKDPGMANARQPDNRGFSLIELLISITVTFFLVYTVYLMLTTSLEAWTYSRHELALQKVLHVTMERVVSGTPEFFGIKDAMELVEAGRARVGFMPPYIDDSHTVAGPGFVYRLRRRMKPSTATPLAEIRLPESREYTLFPARLVDLGEKAVTTARLVGNPPEGGKLRFSYQIDPDENPDVVYRMWWDSREGEILLEHENGEEQLSGNGLGVKITGFEMTYYDNRNNPVGGKAGPDRSQVAGVTGVEVMMRASSGGYSAQTRNFINLRNVPMSSGYVPLRERLSFPIPDSEEVHTLRLTGLTGVKGGDVLRLEARSDQGGSWAIELKFFRVGSLPAKIESYKVEYPAGREIFASFPGTDVEAGLNLMVLDQQGLYDYKDDPEIEDTVSLRGNVTLEVTRMDVEGAALMARP
jgi:hypothetical protein